MFNQIRLTDTLDVEAWYDPEREAVTVKIRHCPTGDMRGGKNGIMFKASLESLFAIAEGQEYPLAMFYTQQQHGKSQ